MDLPSQICGSKSEKMTNAIAVVHISHLVECETTELIYCIIYSKPNCGTQYVDYIKREEEASGLHFPCAQKMHFIKV
uniref:Uncharacterized protein n=1 Tax=Lepeophtheirus salmonis TaxID=72036 RepID=A0A0K2UPR1_LEPSM